MARSGSADGSTGGANACELTIDVHRHAAYTHRRGACAGDDNRGAFIVSKRPQAITDAELAVLRVLWQSGPQTARALAEARSGGGAIGVLFGAFVPSSP